ncbi:Proline/betaine transporter [Nonomuraea coxensis DSM 45129]|uniref:Proline/betaine transporter n=1 Tax=Nonomuraea coxensis DSM 45129 TaxID=1122611 RepID=A0ABX8U339_9ACTN|nr:MFS transporter [Nonomuraea coxensis]QYC42080.1 Proline/betaine transporter [Nonomuraea coxensis DSM 45129]
MVVKDTATPGRTRSGRALTPRQVGFAAMIGNAIELYDFILYSFIAATVFGPLFFPGFEPWLGTLAALSGHAVAFFVRPLGAVVFGRMGDRYGRRPTLLASLVLMGVATVGIGMLPTYAAVGVAAPVVLVLLRLLQGLAVGGEYPGAVVVAVEHAPRNLATFYGALPQIGNMIGILMAGASMLAVNMAVGTQTWLSWGWRIPFLLSGVLVVFGVVLRARLAETPEFVAASARVEAQRGAPGSLATLLRVARRPLVVCVLIWIGPVTFGYAFLTSLLAYVNKYQPGLSATDVQIGLVLTASVLVAVVALSGRHGDGWGRRRVVIVSGLMTIGWAVPAYLLIGTAAPLALWLAMMIGAISYGIFGGVVPAMMSQMFPVEVRYLGVAVAIAASALVGGALLPLPTLAAVGAYGGSPVPLMVMMGLSGLATTVGGLLLPRER